MESIDESAKQGDPDLLPMKELLESYLAKQLAGVFDAASQQPGSTPDDARILH
ncbi:hypothetical protein [Sphingomonas sp.]|uniref:hypothetical protein n=1 Tax=Sphingomonas sp. TaxID=28214 RepID=UPI003B003981